MRALELLLPLLLILALGYFAGTRRGAMHGRDRKELQVLRTQQYKLARVADEHALLGDACAFKVQDIIEATRKAFS